MPFPFQKGVRSARSSHVCRVWGRVDVWSLTPINRETVFENRTRDLQATVDQVYRCTSLSFMPFLFPSQSIQVAKFTQNL